jgi:hypothetical protein
MKKIQEIAQRLIALFVTNALAIIAGSAIVAPELEVWKSACLAGGVAVFKVAETLAKASIDGTLTRAEIDAAFGGKIAPAPSPKRK